MGDDLSESVANEIRKVAGSIGVSLDYPHRPIPAALAEVVLLASVVGIRVAPHVTWLLGRLEQGATTVGPHRRFDGPTSFVSGLQAAASTADPWFSAGSPGETDALNDAAKGTAMMGNAVDMTIKLFAMPKKGTGVPNLNLDSDRGYGYKSWMHTGEPNVSPNPFIDSPSKPVRLEYI